MGISAVILSQRGDREPISPHPKTIETHKQPEAISHLITRSQPSPDAESLPPPPPPGETEDTGYWDGYVWHQKEPPQSKKSWWCPDPNTLLHQFAGTGNAKEKETLAHRIIREHPYSHAALEARLYLLDESTCFYAEDLEDLKSLLKYHPQSPRLLSELAMLTEFDSPEDAVAYGKKALRYIPSSSEDYTDLGLLFTPLEESHRALGIAYQKLGNYKAALVHLKAAQNLLRSKVTAEKGAFSSLVVIENGVPMSTAESTYEACSVNIAAIEAGNPIHKPDTQEPLGVVSPLPLPPPAAAPVAEIENASLGGSLDVAPDEDVPIRFKERKSPFKPPAKEVRAVAAAEQAQAAFQQQQRAQQEFTDFLQWMDAIERAESPAALDNFLMREMASHLSGGETQFEPDRIIRAFETFQRHGETEGLKRLQNADPDIADAVSRQRVNQRVPPRSRRPSQKK